MKLSVKARELTLEPDGNRFSQLRLYKSTKDIIHVELRDDRYYHTKSVSMTVAQATVLRDWFTDAIQEVSQ